MPVYYTFPLFSSLSFTVTASLLLLIPKLIFVSLLLLLLAFSHR